MEERRHQAKTVKAQSLVTSLVPSLRKTAKYKQLSTSW